MKRILFALLFVALAGAFASTADARPHLLKKAAKGMKTVAGLLVHRGC